MKKGKIHVINNIETVHREIFEKNEMKTVWNKNLFLWRWKVQAIAGSRGRPRKIWLDVVKNDMKSFVGCV